MIRFFNTLSGEVEEFVPLEPGIVRMYTCGPTVYDFQHIGNYRAYVFEDLLKRLLVFSGYKVFHVMNITDVDDKTIRGAAALGLTLSEYTSPYIDDFLAGLRTLRILPADVTARATEHIPDMAAMIQGLLDKGYAYRKNGSIYFSIAKFPGYGRLSKIRLESLQPGQRVEADEYEKEDIHDFALWKEPKPGEPVWESSVGPGRPGWHIECSAMSSKYLGPTFDLHCGGIDNIFPHHENEIAQSEAYFGRPFVRTWLHCHHLVRDGEKMAKSKGNTLTPSSLIDQGIDPLDIRYFLLSTHYRKTLNFTMEALAQAQASRRRILDLLYELDHRHLPAGSLGKVEGILQETRTRFIAGLEDDLNISGTLASVFDLVRKVNVLLGQGRLGEEEAGRVLALFTDLDTVLAVLPSRETESLPADIRLRIEAREKARRDKDFALADKLRDELISLGILLEDTREGVRWKRTRPPGKESG